MVGKTEQEAGKRLLVQLEREPEGLGFGGRVLKVRGQSRSSVACDNKRGGYRLMFQHEGPHLAQSPTQWLREKLTTAVPR